MSKKDIVLFDMDGTLTEPRQLFDTKLLSPLRKLSQFADIGIVTGSDYDYLTEQMKTLIRFSELRYVTHLLPCNGTKYYKPPSYSDDEHKLVHEVNMESHLGSECFRQIIMLLCAAQEEMCYYGFPLTGHFISYRGSTINWSPVGRNATTAQRNKFIEIDNSHKPSLRGRELSKISHKINMRCRKEVAIKIGGETSFDIFPKGWDKTYALSHFHDKRCWFVGDRTQPRGNDYEIYQHLLQHGRSFHTDGPTETVLIIDDIIKGLENAR